MKMLSFLDFDGSGRAPKRAFYRRNAFASVIRFFFSSQKLMAEVEKYHALERQLKEEEQEWEEETLVREILFFLMCQNVEIISGPTGFFSLYTR